MSTETQQLSDLARLLANAKNVVVLTGAGVSKESGIPTFRDSLEGYWSRFDPGELATPDAFAKDPETVTRWYDERRMAALACEPNPGHFALARIEAAISERGGRFTLLTQNVDRLHQRAGSQNVVEVHGSLVEWRCTETGERYTDLPAPFPSYPPRSPMNGALRPNVVWFGESLPKEALDAADDALGSCDLYLAIGTSGVVYPATGFVGAAKDAGARAAELNMNDTPVTHVFDFTPRGESGSLLPALYELAFGQGAA